MPVTYIPKQYIGALCVLGFLLCCTVCCTGPIASARTPDEIQIGVIRVKGQKRYSESQIVAASGLKIGQTFDPYLLNAATQKLGDTGALEEVTFSYRNAGGKVAVEFTVKEADKFHRCAFDNFVWVSEQDLQDYLKKEIPLYDGYVPEGGNLTDQIAASLERLNQTRGVSSKVTDSRFGSLGDVNWTYEFTSQDVAIKVSSLQFQGVRQIDEGLLRRAAQPLLGRNYSSGDSGLFAKATFLSIYRDRGFLRVRLDDPSAQITRHVPGSADFEVQLTYTFDEGIAYDWQSPAWAGNQVLSGQKLEDVMGMKPGQRADASKIDHGWEALQNAYGRRGYMDFTAKAEPVFDDANHWIRYKVEILEGAQYHMGSFSIAGVPSATAERLKERWPLKPADVYDTSYLQEFQRNVILPALGSGFHARLISNVRPDRATLTVNVAFQVE